MDKSLCCILTWNRVNALQETISSLVRNAPGHDICIFDDWSHRDGTESFLTGGKPIVKRCPEIYANEYSGSHLGPNVRVFLGNENLGVAGNSNRAIRIFEQGNYQHLCLMNDDLHVLGDFVSFYRQAHADLSVGFLCFSDFEKDYVPIPVNGYTVKLLQQRTGIMMSMTRECVEKVGYNDVRIGKFSNEHCDYTNRAGLAGQVNLGGIAQHCLDVEFADPENPLLKHQDCKSTVNGIARQKAELEANATLHRLSKEYSTRGAYRPFLLEVRDKAGAYGGSGITASNMIGYTGPIREIKTS